MSLFHDNPVLLAAVGQCILGAATVVIMFWWLQGEFNSRAASMGALVIAIDPVILFHTPLILTETLFMFLLLLAVIATWKAAQLTSIKRAALSGFLWSASAMVRPISLYLPLLLCALWRRDKKAMAAFLLTAYLIPAAWTIRNQRETGYPVFSSVSGISLLRYPAAGVESIRTGRSMAEIDVELRAAVDRAHPAGYASDAERSSEYSKAAAPILTAHPFLLARYWAWGIVKALGGTGLEMGLEWWGPSGVAQATSMEFNAEATGQGTRQLLRRHPFLIPIQIIYLLGLVALYLLTARGLQKLWGDGQKSRALFLAGCAAYFLILSGSQGYYRYRIAVMPFFAACAAAAVATELRKK